jgi:hypothetical protein
MFLWKAHMKKLWPVLAASLIALSVAACATNPPPPVAPNPPPKKQADAKTQLESGRKY